MSNSTTTYTCLITNHTTTQKSHHEAHLRTRTYKQAKKIKKLELQGMTSELLIEEYDTDCIDDILDSLETKKIEKKKKKIIIKKSTTMYDYVKFDYVPSNIVEWSLEDDMELNTQYEPLKKLVESVVKQCHQVLYSNCSVVGVKALNDIARILVLKFLESQFRDETSEIWGIIESKRNELNLSQAKFEKYTSLCQDLQNFNGVECKIQTWKLLVKQFLSKIIPDIFQEEDESFNFKDDSILMELISKISTLEITEEFKNTYSTACGDIHEAFRAYGGKKGAKELGQFFTPRKLIHLIFHGLQLRELCEDMEEPEIFDPCMGTGGFLTRIYKLLDIRPENIYGCETELDTIKFAFSSVQLTTGKAISKLQKCDSLCGSEGLDTKKHHIIVTNPPFGTRMKYADLKSKYETNFPDAASKFEDIYPVKTNNGACLFTQMCVHKLVDGGVCAIVLPDGELFNGDGGWSSRFREWLCNSVNIRTILKVPNGTFDHAGVKTNVVIFTKDGPTQNVRFLQTSKDCEEVKELFTVPRDDLEKTGFNLDSDRYEKQEEESYDVPVVCLGDVCNFEPKSKRSAKYGNKTGTYPFYKSSLIVNSFVDEPDFTEESLIIGDGGSANINFSSAFSTSDHCYVFRSIDERISNKYIYYYIRYNLLKLEKYYTGSGLKNISKQNIKKLELPLPSLEVQNRIVEELTQLEESINTIQTRIQQLTREKEQCRKYYRKGEINNLLRDCEEKMLGEVCDFKSYTPLRKKDIVAGNYPVIGGGKKPSGYHNNFNREANTILCSGTGSYAGYISKYCLKIWASEAFSIHSKNNSMNEEYIYYILLDKQETIYSMRPASSGQPHMYPKIINKLDIRIPPLGVQQQCVEIYQNKEAKLKEYDDKIEGQQQYIEELKVLGKDIINSFCNTYKKKKNNYLL